MTATAPAAPGGKPNPTTVPASTDRLERIPLDQLHESPLNPRKHFDQDALVQLKDSLLATGQLEPVLVRPRKGGGYELAAGHRRFRAAKLADQLSPEGARFRGLGQLLAIVRDMDDKLFIETLNIDNLQRDDLHPLEEAQGFKDLMTECGYDVKKIAARIGKSERYVYDSLTLLKLIPAAKKLFLDDRFERGHAIEIARLTTEQQKELIDPDEDWSYGWRVRGLWQDEVADREPDPAQEDLDLEDEEAVKAVSVRELKTFIDDHYRASPATVDPFLFPDAAQVLAEAQAKKGRASRVVHITYDHRVPDAARDEKIKTYGAEAWQRADGTFKSKTCDYAQPGFVAAGPGRGEAFLVCVSKEKCPVHWRDWQRERERRVKERAAQQRRTRTAEDRGDEGETSAAKKKQPTLEPPGALELAWLDEELVARRDGFVKQIKRIIAELKITDEIAWNLTGTDSDCFIWSWAKAGSSRRSRDRTTHAERLQEEVLPDFLPGKWHKSYGRPQPANGTAARASLALMIWLARDTGKLDAEIEKTLDGRRKAWIAEEKRKAAQKAKPGVASKAKRPKKAKKGKQR